MSADPRPVNAGDDGRWGEAAPASPLTLLNQIVSRGSLQASAAAPVVCPACGMPDVREVVRHSDGGRVYHVDLRCLDCDWSQLDVEGGV